MNAIRWKRICCMLALVASAACSDAPLGPAPADPGPAAVNAETVVHALGGSAWSNGPRKVVTWECTVERVTEAGPITVSTRTLTFRVPSPVAAVTEGRIWVIVPVLTRNAEFNVRCGGNSTPEGFASLRAFLDARNRGVQVPTGTLGLVAGPELILMSSSCGDASNPCKLDPLNADATVQCSWGATSDGNGNCVCPNGEDYNNACWAGAGDGGSDSGGGGGGGGTTLQDGFTGQGEWGDGQDLGDAETGSEDVATFVCPPTLQLDATGIGYRERIGGVWREWRFLVHGTATFIESAGGGSFGTPPRGWYAIPRGPWRAEPGSYSARSLWSGEMKLGCRFTKRQDGSYEGYYYRPGSSSSYFRNMDMH